jgi:hypothetical protein
MKKYFILYTVAIFLNSVELYAQSSQKNLEKYWYYRYRLKNYFMVVGPSEGMSLPAHARNIWGGYLTWLENPVIDLGYYLGVLATEYALLQANGQNTDETIRELYYALHAFNRIDMAGDHLWGGTCMPTDDCSLNGYFVRDDIPIPEKGAGSFIENNLSLNYNLVPGVNNYNPPFNELGPIYRVGALLSTSQFTIGGYNPNNNLHKNLHHLMDFPGDMDKVIGLEMSGDEIIGLLKGLMLVAKFVPIGVNYNQMSFQDGEHDIYREVQHITKRIFDWMNGGAAGAGGLEPWMIYRPNGDQANSRLGSGQTSSMRIFTAPLNKIYGEILNTAFYSVGTDDIDYNIAWNTLQDITMGTNLCIIRFDFPDNKRCQLHNLKMIVTLAALSNNWISSIPFPHNSTMEKIVVLSAPHNWHTFYSLLNYTLYGGILSKAIVNNYKDDMQNQLNFAPCYGPNTSDKFQGWAAPLKFNYSTEEQMEGPYIINKDLVTGVSVGEFTRGSFNGLDYMLLHNLYYLTYGDELPKYTNLMHREVNQPFPELNPILGVNIGSQTTPVYIGAFDTLTADNKLLAGGTPDLTAKVTYRAGREINFKPGFEIKPGADFHAYIQPYDCTRLTNVYFKTSPEETESLYDIGFFNLEDNKTPQKNTKESVAYEDAYSSKNENPLTEPLGIVCYPNPAHEVIYIDNYQPNGNWTITVMNMQGKIVYQNTERENQHIISMTDWAKGVYIVDVVQENINFKQRLIIE